MAEPSIFFSEVNERQGVFHRRMFLMGGFAGLGLAALTPSAAWAAPDAPSLSYAEALELARQAAPALRAQQATLAGSTILAPAASALPVGGGRNLHRTGGRNLHTRPRCSLCERSWSRPCMGGSSECCYVTIWSKG